MIFCRMTLSGVTFSMERVFTENSLHHAEFPFWQVPF
jgi:hypothetical protein